MPQQSLTSSLIACFCVLSGCGGETPLNKPAGGESARFEVAGGIEVRRVPGSTFRMGSDQGEQDERPERDVHVSGVFIQANEVTVAEYQACVEAGGCTEPAIGGECNWQMAGRSQHPVNCVSWFDAVRYCDWAEGRLPTEAEWEKAGRGQDGRLYPWGAETADCSRAVVGNGLGCGELSTWPVGAFPEGRSVYGVSDLVGNVYEWTLDAYERDAYGRLGNDNPANLSSGSRKVLRGNSWYYSDPALDSRLSNRYPFPAARHYPYIGFRCAFPGADDPVPFEVDRALADEPQIGPASRTWTDRNHRARLLDGEAPVDGPPVEPSMILVPAGPFRMGSETGKLHERPERTVTLDAFEIDRYEVSVAEYARCVEAGRCVEPYAGGPIFPKSWEWNNCNWGVENREFHPVNCLNWFEAAAYCRWAGKRLPTEAEWEKAARGDDGRLYPWGDEQADCDRAVIDSGGDGCGRETTWPIGSKPMGASPYGVEDMAGNVWEWVEDWYAYDYYVNAPDVNPQNTVEGGENLQPGWVTGKVLRGGSWADQATLLHRTTHRLGYPEDTFPDYTIGFRCARDVP